MAFYVGDIPSEDIVIEPARDDEPIELDPFTAADTDTSWRNFDGELVPAEFLVSFEEAELVIEWPSTSPFEEAGLYSLAVTLVGVERRERLAPIYFVSQAEDGWHTNDSAREEWTTGAPQSDVRLFQLLLMAKQQVTAYAPQLPAAARVPRNYKEGQLMQARNLWNAGKVDPQSGGVGDDEFVIRPYPLDWMVQQVLRPKRGVPVVG